LVLGVLLTGFSLLALNIVNSQLKNMADFYYNLGQVSSSVASGQKQASPFKTQDLKKVIDAYTSVIPH